MENSNISPDIQQVTAQAQQQAQPQPQQQNQTLADKLQKTREDWGDDIDRMEEHMKTLPKLDEMLNEIYSLRQRCVQSFYDLNVVIAKQTKEYKANFQYAFNSIKINGYNGMRFTTDTAIQKQIEIDLQDKKEIIDILTNHANFLKDTTSTIDNMIYGINQKVKIHEMLNGLKF